jgi:hypothetical protein
MKEKVPVLILSVENLIGCSSKGKNSSDEIFGSWKHVAFEFHPTAVILLDVGLLFLVLFFVPCCAGGGE